MNPIYQFQINKPTVNILNPTRVNAGLVNTTNGVVISSTVYQTSDFMPVDPSKNYHHINASGTSMVMAASAFYTKEKTFISGSYDIENTPSNAAYLRVSFSINDDPEEQAIVPTSVSTFSAYVSPIVFPLFRELEKDFEQESGQQFFREKLKKRKEVWNT